MALKLPRISVERAVRLARGGGLVTTRMNRCSLLEHFLEGTKSVGRERAEAYGATFFHSV